MGLSPILPEIQPVTIDRMVSNNGLLLSIELNFVMCEGFLSLSYLFTWANFWTECMPPSIILPKVDFLKKATSDMLIGVGLRRNSDGQLKL